MKLSVLIPTYRYDPRPLVKSLQAILPAEAEILVGDDCSPEDDTCTSDWLDALSHTAGVRLVRHSQNRGAAAMRNTLACEASGDYLLYLDSDGLPLRSSFIDTYLRLLPTDAILCGSICQSPSQLTPDVSLRYKYETAAERRFTAQRRNKNPYQHFRTFNFVIPRRLALQFPFDETVRLSGYEDTLAGRRFEEAGVRILHIENPFLNIGLEKNDVFLQKTERQLRTLHEKARELQGYSSLLSAYGVLRRLHLAGAMKALHTWLQKFERRNLLSSQPSIWVFQLYKLGYYASLQ